jgi:hypothetical protein
MPERFSETYDPEPDDDRPSRSELAEDTPPRPPCGGPCPPDGCFSPRCWQDRPPEADDDWERNLPDDVYEELAPRGFE